MIKSILFFKGFIGPYLRGGKMVNLKGYHSKQTKRVTVSEGQSSLFADLAPPPEVKQAAKVARALTTWMQRHGGPAGMARLLADMSPEHQEKLVDAMAAIGKTNAETVRGMLGKDSAKPKESEQPNGGDLFGEAPAPAGKPHDMLRDAIKRKDLSAAMAVLEPLTREEAMETLLRAGFGIGSSKNKRDLIAGVQSQLVRAAREGKDGYDLREPQHTEPTRELIEEHERLVNVLNSPSHEDDKAEAKKQAEELKKYKRETRPTKDWRDEENWHSRTMGRMKALSENELRFIIKDATEAARNAEAMGSSKAGQYRDEAHYASMELEDRTKATKPAVDDPVKQSTTKAQQTRARRKAALDVLGEGWKAEAGVDGAKDKYSKVFPKAEGGKLEVTIMPEKTVDGNFYVGSYHRGGTRRGAGSNGYAQTIEEAKAMAERFAGVGAATATDPEAELRAMWTKQGVSQERQDALIAQIGGKAAPGAKVGPFTVPTGESAKPTKPAQQDLVDHVKYLGGERKKDLLELAAHIDDYGYSNSVPDNVHIPVKNAAAAINHITRTSRISTEHGLAARKLTGAKARKVLADVAAAGGLGSIQDHIDAFQRIMGGSTMTKSIVFLRKPS